MEKLKWVSTKELEKLPNQEVIATNDFQNVIVGYLAFDPYYKLPHCMIEKNNHDSQLLKGITHFILVSDFIKEQK